MKRCPKCKTWLKKAYCPDYGEEMKYDYCPKCEEFPFMKNAKPFDESHGSIHGMIL